ncbi:hypothetical protein EYF80_019202 [Liparis tanakae]|uniref:Uncharacterized protein n=1 Tax=Liparis tanakae TaxID=230148 RepID=A0A4Z2HY78_9TELE|nr:hypothetical protein EYF80_019202 [Liparis tanakae]
MVVTSLSAGRDSSRWRVTFWEPSRCSSEEEISSVVGTVVSRLMSSDSRSRELETLAAVDLSSKV